MADGQDENFDAVFDHPVDDPEVTGPPRTEALEVELERRAPERIFGATAIYLALRAADPRASLHGTETRR